VSYYQQLRADRAVVEHAAAHLRRQAILAAYAGCRAPYRTGRTGIRASQTTIYNARPRELDRARQRWSTVRVSRRRRLVAGLLVAAAVAWVFVNKPVEGPTLLVLTHTDGVTVADLASVAAVVAAVFVVM
jgi:hypothetical protein